jgi:eukaryotic-like serine/threonine-protein kinase
MIEAAAGTAAEREAIAAVASAMAQCEVPEAMLSACAALLAARGERQAALKMLQRCSSPADLVLQADLLSESGKLADALCAIERVLARDIAYPGARERHERWRAQLSPVRSRPRGSDDVTMALPEQQKAPYQILREVARGGSGAIYEAQDPQLARAIAFKVYHAPQRDRAQLEREARIAVALRGPGVVRVYDVAPEQGWIAIEWAPLGSIRDLLAAGRVQELAPIAQWALPLARAIARVHEAGYVHADLKPANVLLRAPGEPMLCDFGITVRAGDSGLGGSAGYLSPERVAGRPLTPGDDVYGFGRVLEDVLQTLPDPRMRRISIACMGAARPADGAGIVTMLQG